MTEVRIAFLSAHLCADHPITLVGSLDDMFRRDRFGETGPSGAAIELIERGEERLVRDDVDINAGAVIVPVRVSKRRFGSVLARDMVLLGGQLPPEFCVGRHNRFVRLHFLIHLFFALRLAPEDGSNRDPDGPDERSDKRQTGSAGRWMADSVHGDRRIR